jgi:integrase
MESLHHHTLTAYHSKDSWGKVLNFVKAFLKHLARLHMDPRFQNFDLFLEAPKSVKERKTVTTRIITKEDIEHIASNITVAYLKAELDYTKFLNHMGCVLLGAYTGQRVESTLGKLTVGQARAALKCDPPVLHIEVDQDKIRMEHYVPIHPRLLPILTRLIEDRPDDELLFNYMSYQQWIKRNPILLSRTGKHFVCSDTRKFAEQYGDIIQWNQSNRAYILTHGVGGVDWGHYKHPLPESVYSVYMECWADVDLIPHHLDVVFRSRGCTPDEKSKWKSKMLAVE